jgi:excisionase family DNA binding protein
MGSDSGTRWMTTEEAADYLRVTPSTVRRWAREGRFPVYRPDTRVARFRREDLDAYLASGGVDESNAST